MIILLLAWALDELNAKVKNSWKPTNNRKPAAVVFKWEVLSELHENGNTDVQCKIWNWWKTIFNGHCKKEKRLKNLQTKKILQWKRNERNKTCLEMCAKQRNDNEHTHTQLNHIFMYRDEARKPFNLWIQVNSHDLSDFFHES